MVWLIAMVLAWSLNAILRVPALENLVLGAAQLSDPEAGQPSGVIEGR